GQNKKKLKHLPLDMKLNEARLLLNLSLNCNDFGENYLFKHPTNSEIDIEDESKMKLNEIIDKNDNSIKFSKTIDPNWRKLINLCEYGFTITNDISSNKGENILKRKAFIIKQYKKEKCSGTVVTKDDTVLNTELEKLCARNLIFESKASIMLPWLTFYVD